MVMATPYLWLYSEVNELKLKGRTCKQTAEGRKDRSGVITLHKPLPPYLLQHPSPGSVGQKPSSVVERPYVRGRGTHNSGRVVKRPGTEAEKAHTLSPCLIKQRKDQFLSEQQQADAITRPLLDIENGFIKDLECFLKHRDMLSVRKRELLHKRWTECVWRPVQCSVEQRFMRLCYEGVGPMNMMHTGYVNYIAKVTTAPLKDPLFSHSHSRMKEKRAVLHCQTGSADGCHWMSSVEEQSRNKSGLDKVNRSQGPVYMATPDGRCFRPECWSAIGLSHSYSMKS